MRMLATPKFVVFLINLVASLVEGLLSLRVVLKLLGASTVAPFVRWVYETTQPLLAPFSGMFPSPRLPEGIVIEFTALFALMVYAFIGYLATELIKTLVYYGNQRELESEK